MLVPLKRTPLEKEHEALGAKMGEFGGWVMPIEYEGTLAEHKAVREAVGMFDLTHLGKVEVLGAGALTVLQRALSNDVSRVEVGQAQYNLVLTPDGGIVDDLIVYRTDPENYLVVPNAANTERVTDILGEEVYDDVAVIPREDLATLAVQGPRAMDLVGGLFPDATALAYMHNLNATYRDQPVTVARSGYTGEVGFELFVSGDLAPALWSELVEAGRPMGLQAAGLGARDTLRLEMGYPLHGNDIADDRTPIEAKLSWAVAFEKGEFTGRDTLVDLKEQGPSGRPNCRTPGTV